MESSKVWVFSNSSFLTSPSHFLQITPNKKTHNSPGVHEIHLLGGWKHVLFRVNICPHDPWLEQRCHGSHLNLLPRFFVCLLHSPAQWGRFRPGSLIARPWKTAVGRRSSPFGIVFFFREYVKLRECQGYTLDLHTPPVGCNRSSLPESSIFRIGNPGTKPSFATLTG